MGKVESGTVRVGMNIRVMPVNVRGRVDKIYVNEVEVLQALPGENIKLKLKGVAEADLHKGCVQSLGVFFLVPGLTSTRAC